MSNTVIEDKKYDVGTHEGINKQRQQWEEDD